MLVAKLKRTRGRRRDAKLASACGVASRDFARDSTGRAARKYPHACSQLLNWHKDRGGVTCGKEPRSEIVNTFSHSPIFRATTAQPLVKNHASSRLPRIGAPPFRRPLRHSIVRFRAPTTPESRERNDHALCIGACCFADGSCTLRQLCVRLPRSAWRFPRTHTFGMPRLDAATLLLHLRKSYTLSGDHPYVLYLVCSFFFCTETRGRLTVAITWKSRFRP